MKKSAITILALSAVMSFAMGCGRLINEGVGVVVGPRGVYSPLEPLPDAADARPLADYQRFELGHFRQDAAGGTPPALFALLPGEFARQVRQHDLPDVRGGKTAIVSGHILHYEEANIFGHAFGPVEQVVARVELTDAETGQLLAAALCIGRNEETLTSSVRDRTAGLAKAIASWIAANFH